MSIPTNPMMLGNELTDIPGPSFCNLHPLRKKIIKNIGTFFAIYVVETRLFPGKVCPVIGL